MENTIVQSAQEVHKDKITTKKLVFMGVMIAMGVVISPFLRVLGFCPMQHFINVIMAVMVGPWYGFVGACCIGIIRMAVMGIPPLALTGAVIGAFLSGLLYRMFHKNIAAVIGEIIGTGVIGSMVSYPVMTFIMKQGGLSLFYYTPSFVIATILGGSLAWLFLLALGKTGQLEKFQKELNQ
ncbi:MAG: energy coupling factor transporter S component ThiW [Eubacteriales bacterium]